MLALSRFLLLSRADKVHHFGTLEEFIFLISAWLRINVPFLNFPTCPTFPFDKMLGADFLDLLCWQEEKVPAVRASRTTGVDSSSRAGPTTMPWSLVSQGAEHYLHSDTSSLLSS